MSCKMKIDTFTVAEASETCEVHLMPCKIDYTGEAKVRQYFSPVVTPKSADCSDGKKLRVVVFDMENDNYSVRSAI